MEKKDIPNAEKSFKKALKINLRLKDIFPSLELHVAANYHQLGICAQVQLQYKKAEKYFLKTLEIVTRLKLTAKLADIYHQLSSIFRLQNNFEKATEFINKAQAIREEFGYKRKAAKGFYELSILARKRKNFDEAKIFVRKALIFFEAYGPELGRAKGYEKLGKIAIAEKKFDEAFQWISKALLIFNKYRSIKDIVALQLDLGLIFVEKGAFDKAKKTYEKAIEICTKTTIPSIKMYLTAVIEHNLAMMYHKKGEIKMAIKTAGTSLEKSLDLKSNENINNTLSLLLLIEKEIGNKKIKNIWLKIFGNSYPLDFEKK